MKIAFVDGDPTHDYDVTTPWSRPIGGSESAEVYLAVELARLGHEVHLFTATSHPRFANGVHCRHHSELGGSLRQLDVIVTLNRPILANEIRRYVGPGPLVFRHQQNVWPSPEADSFRDLGEGDYVLCVSQWQRDHFLAQGVLSADRILVLRNAISPVFEGLFSPGEDIVGAKARPPALAFTSVPYKGLHAAIALFPHLRRLVPSVELHVFSAFDLYPVSNPFRAEPGWQTLYDQCRSTPGIRYFGNVPQPELAQHLRRAIGLFYPNTAAETSSIAVMEAMAAGCRVVATALAALPETMAGFGDSVAMNADDLDSSALVDRARALVGRFLDGDPTLGAELRHQVDFVQQGYRWSVRARQFETMLENLRA